MIEVSRSTACAPTRTTSTGLTGCVPTIGTDAGRWGTTTVSDTDAGRALVNWAGATPGADADTMAVSSGAIPLRTAGFMAPRIGSVGGKVELRTTRVRARSLRRRPALGRGQHTIPLDTEPHGSSTHGLEEQSRAKRREREMRARELGVPNDMGSLTVRIDHRVAWSPGSVAAPCSQRR